MKTSLGPDASALSIKKQCLYISVTNDAIGTPLTQSVGPGFTMPPSVGYGLPAFEPLSASALTLAEDPQALADALAEVVEDAWDRGFIKQDSMESDPVTFAGLGDPLLRLDTIEMAAKAIKYKRHGAQLRLMTNGLVAQDDAAEVVKRLQGCGVKMLTVPLNAATPPKYEKLMAPPAGLGFREVCDLNVQMRIFELKMKFLRLKNGIFGGGDQVCNFVMVAAEHGMSVECTAVSLASRCFNLEFLEFL